MKNKRYLLMIFLILLFSACYEPTGCYGPMTGTAVDAETGKPLEGAVVYVEWTVTTGLPGLKSAKTYKVVEKVTDNDGKFTVFGILNPMANRPIVVVYKKGYMAWRSDYVFPESEHRKDFEWKGQYVFKLGQFRDNYSHSKHIFFLSSGLALSSTKLEQAYSWEVALARKEEEIYRHKLKIITPGKLTEKEIWTQIVEELYLKKGERANE